MSSVTVILKFTSVISAINESVTVCDSHSDIKYLLLTCLVYSAVMSMYIGAKTVVRTVYGNSKGFEVKVGMHQGSGLSPLLFVIVMEAISGEFRVALPWELLYADDLAVIAETEEELIKSMKLRV